MEEKKPVDRRKYVRINVETKVNFRVKGKEEGKAPPPKIAGISKDMSVEGICFRTDRELTSGTELEMEVFFPHEPAPLLLKGEVRWSHPLERKGEGKPMFEAGVRLFTFEKSDETYASILLRR